MIPADSSIDDEPPLFPVSFYGKRLQRYEHANTTHIHRQLALSISSKTSKTTVGTRRSQDPAIARTKLSAVGRSER